MKQGGHGVVTLVSIYRTLSEVDISAPCNSLCHCSGRDYDPVCGVIPFIGSVLLDVQTFKRQR